MKKINNLLLISMLFITFTSLARTSDLLISPVVQGNKMLFNIEFVNDEKATSMQFDIDLHQINPKNINFKNCLIGLSSKTHQGGCNIVNNKLRILIYSMSNALIPSGVLGNFTIDIGSFDRTLDKSKNMITVEGMKMSAPGGAKLNGSAYVDTVNKGALSGQNIK